MLNRLPVILPLVASLNAGCEPVEFMDWRMVDGFVEEGVVHPYVWPESQKISLLTPCVPNALVHAALIQSVQEINSLLDEVERAPSIEWNGVIGNDEGSCNSDFNDENITVASLYGRIAILGDNSSQANWKDGRDVRTAAYSNQVIYNLAKADSLRGCAVWLPTETVDVEQERHEGLDTTVILDRFSYIISHELLHCLGVGHSDSRNAVMHWRLPSDSFDRDFSYEEEALRCMYGTPYEKGCQDKMKRVILYK